MAAGQHNIIIEEGNAFYIDFTWYKANGQTRDLTNATAIFYLKHKVEDENCFVKAEEGGAGAVTVIDELVDPGMIKVGIHAALLEEIPFDYGYYQLDIVFDEEFDNPVRICQGRVSVMKYGGCNNVSE